MRLETRTESTVVESTSRLRTRAASSFIRGEWQEFAWPCILIPALLGAIVLSTQASNKMYTNAITIVRDALYWTPFSSPAAKEQPVLVVVGNRDREMQVIATLSPRGYKPSRAESLGEIRQMFPSAKPELAVLDSATPGSDAILRYLKTQMPEKQIVVLNRSIQREAIGQILLDRL